MKFGPSYIFLCATFGFFAVPRAHADTFLLRDPRGPNQISEITRFYLDGKLAATIKLQDGAEISEKLITTSDVRKIHHYALCGDVTFLNAFGKPETRKVDSEGTLTRPDGHVLVATADDNLTDFYLMDLSDPAAAKHHRGAATICSGPIS